MLRSREARRVEILMGTLLTDSINNVDAAPAADCRQMHCSRPPPGAVPPVAELIKALNYQKLPKYKVSATDVIGDCQLCNDLSLSAIKAQN